NVSWKDCQVFVGRLNARQRKLYRLPTEQEWEYACRAGTTTAYSFGNDIDQLLYYGWSRLNGAQCPQPVGRLKPNSWGLYDMHGNVAEWCSNTFTSGTRGALTAVHRGGAWINDPATCRSAARYGDPDNQACSFTGLRLCMDAYDEHPETPVNVASTPKQQPTYAPTQKTNVNTAQAQHVSASPNSIDKKEEQPKPAPPTPQDIDNLRAAAFRGDAATCEALIAKGVDVNAHDAKGLTALHYAAMSGQTEVAKLLIDQRANIKSTDNEGLTPEDWARATGQTDLLVILRPK
ncbi:MAG: SUMF1/EgtB/PvdO family nonheme iron enzyme, partial [Candidatus Hydrogenedentes bacterium]|nr:SUMF1/EgtB/PvdO family nonheme iron enzyme [Candidatus Hydrogenedentota bacterium]